MSANATLRANGGNGPAWPQGARRTGLWVFMVVVSTLFGLFGVAYMMRAAYEDWRPITYVPWQLYCSTGLLVLCSLAWELARRHVAAGRRDAARSASIGALVLSAMFVLSQLYAWQAMTAADYGVAANPANSFFYLITGLHAVHVMGGMVAAAFAVRKAGEAIGLCAQYWHFLFVLWLALFALLFMVTPDLVRAFCSTIGIPVR
ncbi:bb3-type cytochrome oxidase subunit III [Pseudoduganella eburnea]|uniref:Bb3-type cytochrome oxidase subunit III n=1 Tax=Massilia eburnea TaxID=1776165 RepID=A0A6L6QG40_9BURK|nr:cytochrome c oxidase subunit 3 [Massilia eburnea]MTW11215.1 bb3-type cytochrome oxidase subunit III [Massilia eburnea]